MTTHAILKQTFNEEAERLEVRRVELQKVGQKLLRSYQESLILPSEMFEDRQGQLRNYVSTGFINDKGLFQTKNISSLELNRDLNLSFIISTVIDESGDQNIAYSETPVSIYKEVGTFYVDVGKKHLSIRVFQPDAMDAFHEVNIAIKETILADIIDPRLKF